MKNLIASSPAKYRPDIDGLRAIAVLAVVGFHAFPRLFKSGFVGVDVFFVISGFLISTLLFESLAQGHFSFREFYGKRIKRIFPALLLVLLFCSVFGWLLLFPNEYQQLGKHIAGGAGFIANFLLWQESGYFDTAAETKPLLHLWSLGIEEQFYIIWPLLLWAAWKKRISLLAIISSLALISFTLNVKNVSAHGAAVFYSPQSRFWELLCGSLLAWYLRQKPVWQTSDQTTPSYSLPINHFLSFLGFLLIECSIYTLTKINFPGLLALIPTIGTALIILAGSQAWINRVILSNRIMIWFGLISFPLYLWHWPLLSFARIIEDEKPNKTIRIAAVLLSIFLAWLTYQCLEKPIRFGKRFNKTKTTSLIVCMFLVSCLGFYIYQQQGLIARFKNLKEVNTLVSLIDHPYPSGNDFFCANLIPELKQLTFDGGCRLSKKSAPTILFVGDSHTAHYYNAVWKQFPKDSVLMVVQTSCLPFSNSHFLTGECREKYEAIISYLTANSSIKKVYLSGHWAYLMTGGFAKQGEHWRHAKAIDAEGVKTFKESGRHFLASVLTTKKEIVFLKDIPDLDFNIKSCFKIRPLQLTQKLRQKCWMDANQYAARVAEYDQVIDELLAEFPQVKIYDPRPLLCKNNKCIARDEKLPYYFNGDHLNHYGANLVIKDLLATLNT